VFFGRDIFGTKRYKRIIWRPRSFARQSKHHKKLTRACLWIRFAIVSWRMCPYVNVVSCKMNVDFRSEPVQRQRKENIVSHSLFPYSHFTCALRFKTVYCAIGRVFTNVRRRHRRHRRHQRIRKKWWVSGAWSFRWCTRRCHRKIKWIVWGRRH
jgi:hypothetical protein